MTDRGAENLAHVVADDCTDPDCELHHPEVGREEGTVSETDMAFWLAGYKQGQRDEKAFPRSGAEARERGMVEAYADRMKETLMAPPKGYSEEDAERMRQQIIERFGS